MDRTVIDGQKNKRSNSQRHKSDPHGKLYLGIDIGSTSSDLAVLDGENNLIYTDYCRTKGRPIETLRRQLKTLNDTIALSTISSTAITGGAGRTAAKLLEAPYVNEVPAQAQAIAELYPSLQQASIIEMGGQDNKLIFISRRNGRLEIKDFALNTACAAGTGSFLDQQAQRLGVNIEEEFGTLALQSVNVPRIAGRCSVFAKSDMIHLQQQATSVSDIVAGLCLALVQNLRSNLGGGRDFDRPIIFTGGVAANAGVIKSIERVFDLEPDELLVPECHFFTGAIGAVLLCRARNEQNQSRPDLKKLDHYLKTKGSALKRAPRRDKLKTPQKPVPQSRVYSELLENTDGPIEAYLGIDVGSISTNLVVIDKEKRVLSKLYLMTAGRPLEAVRTGLETMGREVGGKVKILGAATTGSGRYLTGDFIGADVVINEITAQAAGAAIVNPKVDTIFEIGGQDSKYISIENGVVVDFEMNHACAAGTGSFLEEQAQRLGISIKDEFSRLAFESGSPLKIGERCTVFMESDLLSYQQQGSSLPDLVAGLSYSVVTNYINRVVGRRKIGNNICFQGGTAFNKAVWAAFEMITGKPITVPDHHEVTGALGAASIALQSQIEGPSKFKGFADLAAVNYELSSFTCKHCPNHCEIKKVQVGNTGLFYGAKCDRYDVKKKTKTDSGFEAFKFRNQKLIEFSNLSTEEKAMPQTGKSIAIPRALIFWQQLPLYSNFFKELGFEVIVSDQTDKETIRQGLEHITAPTCFPVKVAYGHVARLIEKKPDYIFLPSIVSMTPAFENNNHNQLCPYVQSLPYQVRTAFEHSLGRVKLLTPVIRLGEGKKLVKKSFAGIAEELGISKTKALEAYEKGWQAQSNFEKCLRERGREIIESIKPGQKLFVLVSRPYNGCDEGVNLELTSKLAEHGVDVIPMDMLDLSKASLSDRKLHDSVYWSYGQKILRSAEIIKEDPRLFAIYLSNFSCGPDSFLTTFFRDLMNEKPCLQLELDEHSADAGVITRIEAFLESLKHYQSKNNNENEESSAAIKMTDKGRRLYLPYMGDAAFGMAAVFRSHGIDCEVMPIATDKSLNKGRQYTNGKECLPFAITAGDMLNIIEMEDPERIAFFMPGGCGPCRFGMYNCLHRLVLKYANHANIPVLSPVQDHNFYEDFEKIFGIKGIRSLTKDLWVAVSAIELLQKLLLRIRPYAKKRMRAQKVYDNSLQRMIRMLEEKSPLKNKVKLLEAIAEDFAAIELDHNADKPRIGIVGEIYVRNHPFANANIIERLEGLGVACDLTSSAEWIYYTNVMRKRMASRRGLLRRSVSNSLTDIIQRKIERTLAEPLEKKFPSLAEGDVKEVLELAADYIDENFEGEAVLSVGKMIEYHHQGFAGVVNVMPFGCMPSTIVSTQTMKVSKDCDNMPILNLSFDGQEDATLITHLEAFAEQVRERKSCELKEPALKI